MGKKSFIVILIMIFSFSVFTIANAFKLKSFLEKAAKVEAARQVVKVAAKPLNSFINTVLMQHGAGITARTKVVPIVKAGTSLEVGMAQVTGATKDVERVRAVYELDTHFGGNHRFTVRIFIPSSHMNPLKFDRVQGVGVSAILEGRI